MSFLHFSVIIAKAGNHFQFPCAQSMYGFYSRCGHLPSTGHAHLWRTRTYANHVANSSCQMSVYSCMIIPNNSPSPMSWIERPINYDELGCDLLSRWRSCADKYSLVYKQRGQGCPWKSVSMKMLVTINSSRWPGCVLFIPCGRALCRCSKERNGTLMMPRFVSRHALRFSLCWLKHFVIYLSTL